MAEEHDHNPHIPVVSSIEPHQRAFAQNCDILQLTDTDLLALQDDVDSAYDEAEDLESSVLCCHTPFLPNTRWNSATTSLRSSIHDYIYENGRRYHAYRAGQYWYDCKECIS